MYTFIAQTRSWCHVCKKMKKNGDYQEVIRYFERKSKIDRVIEVDGSRSRSIPESVIHMADNDGFPSFFLIRSKYIRRDVPPEMLRDKAHTLLGYRPLNSFGNWYKRVTGERDSHNDRDMVRRNRKHKRRRKRDDKKYLRYKSKYRR